VHSTSQCSATWYSKEASAENQTAGITEATITLGMGLLRIWFLLLFSLIISNGVHIAIGLYDSPSIGDIYLSVFVPWT